MGKNKKKWIYPLFATDWRKSWIEFEGILNIFYMLLFEKVLSTIPHQKLGLFLYENQGWERIFIHLWKKMATEKLLEFNMLQFPFGTFHILTKLQ